MLVSLISSLHAGPIKALLMYGNSIMKYKYLDFLVCLSANKSLMPETYNCKQNLSKR